MTHIGIPNGGLDPRTVVDSLVSIQDMGIETMKTYITMHNLLMKVMFPFLKMEEVSMGNMLPGILLASGSSAIIGETLKELQKFLP